MSPSTGSDTMTFLRYMVPNAITCGALACGVVAIVLAMTGEPLEATWWILYATLLDRMDGLAARALKAFSKVGAQLDSLSDFVAFGLAPAFVFYGAVSTEFVPVLLVPMMLFVIGCAVRLARFTAVPANEVFEGVASTMAGGIFAAAMNVALRHEMPTHDLVGVFAVVLVVFGVAMNLPWLRYNKVGGGRSRFLRLLLVSLAVICAVLIVTHQLPELLLGITVTTLVLGPPLTAWDRRERA